jgi:HAD superfamily hydrolase (TIGR01549 family)
MPISSQHGIRAIVFDLDGTLYVSDRFAATIQEAAVAYMAGVKGIPRDEMARLMAAARTRLADESGTVPTLSAVCSALGGSIPALHGYFEEQLRPESYLVRDSRVVALLEHLSQRFRLYIYTNNNHALATRITAYLGCEGFFHTVFAIDDTWRPKPDNARLEEILATIGLAPAEVLFVGDRYEVDLRLAEQKGCPIFLSQSVDQLLRLDKLIG